MISLTNSEIVYKYIKNKVTLDYLIKNSSKNSYLGIDAAEIQKNLNIVRNNASTILNELLKNDKLIKINSRPVTFIPKDILFQFNIPESEKKTIIFSPEEFKKILKTVNNNSEKDDPFKHLIGHNNSLAHQIEQAKAAIMYPPHGLHTLILGESGVGKTTFASALYEYGKLEKNLDSEAFPFISFNCSDYFNAPQLLLSQLFGHAKGAFTGADSDKIGLVEKANNGILFLDEVHRLPADGQEMLFYLMDKGDFSRLGETSTPRKSNVLIIAATTEDPSDTFLSTFLRRIPVIINLPSFREKTIDEKLEVIEKLFHYESMKLDMPIKISPQVLKALALYDFKGGNIGQLSSEIKLLCAKAFFQYLQNEQELSVDFKMLNKDIKEYIFSTNPTTSNTKTCLNIFTNGFVVHPSKTLYKEYHPDDLNKDVYDSINKKLEELKNQGLSKENIDIEINNELENLFNSVISKINNDDLNIRNLYKIVPKDIVDASADLVNFAQSKLNTKFSSKFFFGFTFHIHSLLKRVKENKIIRNPNMAIIKRQYHDEFKTSSELVKILSEKFGVLIPEDEKGFLSILLANNKLDNEDDDNIGIILVCHGDSTATSMANVANKLLNVDYIKAIDMPLTAKTTEIYEKVKATVLAINKGKGVLLLVDMGSLSTFGEKIMNETGIKIRTIDNVSTLLVLDALRSILYKKDDLDITYNSLINTEIKEKTSIKSRKKAILTACITGQGAGLVIKNILVDLIKNQYKDLIEVVAVSYNEIENNLNDLGKKYDILACIGSLRPQANIPYFPMNKLLDKDFQIEFLKFLDTRLASSSKNTFSDEKPIKSVYQISKEMLEQYVKYINPKLAVAAIKKFTEKLNLNYDSSKQDNLIDLIIHMGCMLDRCVHGLHVKFESLHDFKNANINQFTKVREAISILEKEYSVGITDDEICYIIKVINR